MKTSAAEAVNPKDWKSHSDLVLGMMSRKVIPNRTKNTTKAA